LLRVGDGPELLARQILEFLEDPRAVDGEMERLAAALNADFTWGGRADQLLTILSDVLSPEASQTAAVREDPEPGVSAIARTRRRVREYLGTSPLLNEIAGCVSLLRAGVAFRRPARYLEHLTLACRRLTSPYLRSLASRLLRRWQDPSTAGVWRDRQIGWTRYWREYDLDQRQLTTSLLLKGPGPDGEKGVLYSSFEYNWLRLLAHHDARRFLADYFLVGASSWSPPDYAVMLGMAGLSADPVFLGVSNPADVIAYRVAEPTIQAVPIMACDWINPDFYQPRAAADRDIDILMVANFSPFKRHWLLFEALRHMRRDLRVALVGIPVPGRGAAELRQEARALGALQDLEIVTNAPIATVTAYQCRAKTSLVFSLREGSCVAVTESLFAGSPVGILRKAHIGAKAYINSQTGTLLRETGLSRQLDQFLETSDSYRSREWALDHITCHHASTTLNGILRDYSKRAGHPWTRDITPLCWRYVPSYLDPRDAAALAPEVARLRSQCGIDLKQFSYQPT
jgi:glycosyltransferase involved in cell wall biosynthesis